MKISAMLFFVLIIAGFIFIFASMINEANTQYPSANINATVWNSSKYNYAGNIESQLKPLQDRFAQITDTDTGFFTKIGAGIIAIPYAIILVPSVVIGSMGVLGNIATSLLTDMGIPAALILLVTIGILIWGVLKMVEFFNKTPI